MRKLSKFIINLILIIILLTSTGCTYQSEIMAYDSRKFVDLYDFSELSVDYDYTQITEEDMKSIVNAELSINEAYMQIKNRTEIRENDIIKITIDGNDESFYFIGSNELSKEFDSELLKMKINQEKNIRINDNQTVNVKVNGIYRLATIDDTEFVLDYYGYNSIEDLKNFLRLRAADEIIFNYAFDIIEKNSTIKSYPSEINKLIGESVEVYKNNILKNYASVEEYLDDNNMTEDDLENSIKLYYQEIMLYKAILDSNNETITKSDISEYIDNNKIDNSESEYDIYKLLAEEKVRTIITEIVEVTDEK